MENLTHRLTEILRYGLPKEYTSISYAIMKDGKLLAADSIGHLGDKDKTPATTCSTYNVASVSKIYCTVAVMQLVEQGKVELDTPVYKYLPKLWMPDERYKKITVRHCLSHTSGLPGTQWKGFSVSSVKDADYYADVYDYMSKNYLKAEPGEYAVYCNDGFTLAEMVVAEVSGEKYEDYCMNHITEPIGAHSSRLSPNLNPAYPLVRQSGRTPELLLIQGGAGYTTDMTDLCIFGNQFLNDSAVISEASKAEMAKKQGATFLKKDERSCNFGLGWDTVCYAHPDYDLGDGALLKGGNSFQFDTQFIVIPKYNTVLAISETHDCRQNINECILRLFATAMWETEGVSIYRSFKPVPKEYADEYAGTYLVPSGILNLHMFGAHCAITMDDTRGGHKHWFKTFNFDGEQFSNDDKRTLLFEHYGDDIFALSAWNGVVAPMAQKAKPAPAVSQAWKGRVGKKYVVVDASPYDIVVTDVVTGFKVALLPGNDGVVVISGSGRDDSGVYGLFEGTVKPIDDSRATGFLRTPSNPSRDMLTPIFELRDGVEYCCVASYTYRDAATLPLYEGQGFGEKSAENKAYRLPYTLSRLPEVPEDRRLMILNDELQCVYDSLRPDSVFKPIDKGYLLFI